MATQTQTLSIVINTKNSADTLKSCLQSVKRLADDLVVMDMNSTDKTVQIAKQFGARVYTHPDIGFVEPARNAAIKKAKGQWILILDADEEIPPSLGKYILDVLVKDPKIDAYFLPRQNEIFGKIVTTGWWPDHVLRLFRAGHVSWKDEIHSVPDIDGTSVWVEAKSKYAILHHHYQTIDQFIDRAQRYGKIVAEQSGSALQNPFPAMSSELLRRYYAWEGHKDAQHGYMLSLLQMWTALLPTLYVWEQKAFPPRRKQDASLAQQLAKLARDAQYWEARTQWESSSGIQRFWWRIQMIRWK